MKTPALAILVLIAVAALVSEPPPARGGDGRPATSSPRQEALVQLGRRLFFDPLVSRSGTRSCASCHDPDHGFSDPARVSDDDFGRTRRHSQTLIDTHRNPSAHWDGEFASVERLVLARIGPLSGRRGKLGHGASLLDAAATPVGGEPLPELLGDPEEELGEEPVEEDVLDDDDELPGGGGGDQDYDRGEPPRMDQSPSSRGTPAAPTTPGARGAAGTAGAPEGPAAKAPAPKADGPKPAPQAPAAKKKDEPKEDKQAGKAGAMSMLSPRERQRRADELRRALQALPLASEVLEAGGRYDEAFAAAFGNRRVNDQRIARAIQAYCDSLHATTAPIDRHLAGEEGALSPAAKRGLALFRGRAGCVTCHTMEGKRPAFTDFGFHNTGVVWHRLSREARAKLAAHDETFRRKRDGLEQARGPDEGRARISTRKPDLRGFKTPTLRDVTRRGPFMHDGRFRDLRAVIRYYARGASGDPAKSPHVAPFDCSDRDVEDLVAFLEALEGETRVGLPERAWRKRAPKTRLQFVDADGKPLRHLSVRLLAVGDLAYRGAEIHPEIQTTNTGAKGWIEFTQRRRTHTQIVLPDGLAPRDGAFVPDSCQEAQVVVPVRGHTHFVLRLHRAQQVPETLVAEHLDTTVLPGHQVPRTLFARGLQLGGDATTVLVTYSARLRTDVPTRVRLRVPGPHGATATVDLSEARGKTIDCSR